MFGALGNLANVMKQAAQIKENMQKHQEQLARQTHEADAGGGLVKVTVNGRCELISIKIDPEAAKDVELRRSENQMTALRSSPSPRRTKPPMTRSPAFLPR